ncbi:RDD family protein [Haloarcula litorea]|uniref:RDD family protein n=1 Tax=Haloarcula litorea TaxID=3032579 RepID=UPI0023E84153|nr:RDD family protein [Halomicroarcula sp. GDY20]
MPPSTLGLFGVIHMDRRGKVTGELSAFVDDADALFIEYPRDLDDPWLFGRLLARVPTYLLGAMLLQLLVYAPLYVLFVRDLLPTEVVAARAVAAERDLPVHRVDDHPHLQMRDASLPVAALSWLLLAGVAWLAPVATAVTAALALGGGLVPVLARREGYRYPGVALALLGLAGAVAAHLAGLLSAPLVFVGVLSFLAAVVVTVQDRNEVMLDRIERLSAERGYGDAVLVTGKGHLGGLARLARERGLAVRAAHVSKWLRAGTTHEDAAAATLPEVGLGGSDEGVAASDLPGETDDGTSALGRRAAAALLDLVVGGVFAAGGAVATVAAGEAVSGVGDTTLGLAALAAAVAGWLAYHVALETLTGQTLGKRLRGLRVVRQTGRPITAGDALVRNVLRPLDAAFLYGLGVLLVLVTERDQRLGDLAARTVVARTG